MMHQHASCRCLNDGVLGDMHHEHTSHYYRIGQQFIYFLLKCFTPIQLWLEHISSVGMVTNMCHGLLLCTSNGALYTLWPASLTDVDYAAKANSEQCCLQGHRVTVIFAIPTWIDQMVTLLKASNGSNIEHSHLYANVNMQIGTWQRIDIPILSELSQYEYVLFTDADVYFRRPMTMNAFRLPLPETIGMATEGPDAFPFNAGIMLMHLPAMRQTYDAFLKFVFSNEHGLYFPGMFLTLAH